MCVRACVCVRASVCACVCVEVFIAVACHRDVFVSEGNVRGVTIKLVKTIIHSNWQVSYDFSRSSTRHYVSFAS